MSKIEYAVSEILKEDGLTWKAAAEKAGYPDRSNFRRALLARLTRANDIIALLGYEIQLVKKEEE